MGLQTDRFFSLALAGGSTEAMVDGRIFYTARETADEEADKVPYIIITLESVQNQESTKDSVEGYYDTAVVNILCVGKDRESLAELTQAVRKDCVTYLDSIENGTVEDADHLCPLSWQFSADAVQYDPDKPCSWQVLHYSCDVLAE